MRLIFLMVLAFLISCRNTRKEPLFTLMKGTGVTFENTVQDTPEENSLSFRNFYNGGGVALGDLDNDGKADIVLTSNMGKNRIYRNLGDFRFEDITDRSGLADDSLWHTGVSLADVNADGWLDIYICSSGHVNSGKRLNKLYINNHHGQFTEEGARYGLDVSGYCTQASFFDYDLDGDLDCFIINNSPIPFSSLNYAGMRDTEISKWNIDKKLQGGGNHLYRNDHGHFSEVTKEAGLHSGLISFGLGVSIGDINGDHYPDIYVGNDFIEKDYLYINQKNGTFRDELEDRLQQISMSSMSSDLGDINNDGKPEIFTTDMIPDDDYRLKTTGTYDNIDLYLSKQKAGLYHQFVKNCLQLNNGEGRFSEVGNCLGISATDWSWGALFLDADNDGRNDLFVCNGINKDLGDLDFLEFFSNDVYQQMLQTGKKQEVSDILKEIPVHPIPNRFFRNKGDLVFTDATEDWGFQQPTFSNSVAYGDLDNDGDLDLVINNENAPASLYRNNARQQNKNHYISLQLKGKEGNPFAVGSRVEVHQKASVLWREVNPSRGFQASVDYRQVIGLGDSQAVDSLVIIWPDRTRTRVDRPATDRLLLIEQTHSAVADESIPAPIAMLVADSSFFDRHREDEYVDFYYERNLPELLSREGPHAAIGDANGDGKEDVYICGAKDQAGQLYLQTKDGFIKKKEPSFQAFADLEDVTAVFFDADGDGDEDLFVGAGGNNAHPGSRALQHRLYRNDGKGNFEIDTGAFPPNNDNISTALVCDLNGDSYPDLFIGGRSVPYQYGVLPRSYLLQNDGKGHFTDVTEAMSPELVRPGMLTSAAWGDLDGDGTQELVVAGIWMAPRIFSCAHGKMKEWTNTALQNEYGWWESLSLTDVNGDGKPDLVLGNIGDNFYLHPSPEQPVKLWVADFDGNGITDQFLTRSIGGRDVPVFLKREITDQFPALKKSNLKHSDYARKQIGDLFPAEILEKASVQMFTECRSVVALNAGGGRFSVQPLPMRVQLSSINAICAADINGDGKPDLVTGGNLFSFPPQFGRLDASYGDLLLNEGNGNFQWIDPQHSGLLLTGEIKDIKHIQTDNGPALLALRNDQKPVLLKIRRSRL